MSINTHVRRRPPALSAAVLAALGIACAVPAAGLAAAPDGSRTSLTQAGSTAERSSGGSAERSATGRDDDARTRAQGARSIADVNPRPYDSSGQADGDSQSTPAEEGPSRADEALAGERPTRAGDGDLGDSVEAIRRAARARAKAARAEARGRADDVRRASRSAVGRSDSSPERGESTEEARRAGSEPDSGVRATAETDGSNRIELLPGNHNIVVRRRALVRGHIPSGRAGRSVLLELLSGGQWVTVDRAETIEDGRFYLAWYPSKPGYFRVRVRESSDASEPSGVRLLYVFREVVASWYGPGFYGNRTACGQTFTNRLIGVAHKSLPCGHRLTVRYRGRSRTVRVVDRGPYVRGRTYDLTEALRNYLGFDGVDEILATS